MSGVQLPMASGDNLTDQSAPLPSADDLSQEIQDLLNTFDGETSLKRLFWEMLSYDRVRDPLPLTFLPRSAAEFVATLEVFADSEAYTIVLAIVRYVPLGGLLEQMAWALKRNIPNCILLLEHAATWSVVYPDEVLKPRVRILPLPGTFDRRDETVHALAALNAADEDSGEDLSILELAQGLDASFPGATPNIGDLLTDFKRIEEHPDHEMREMWPFIKAAGQYPLLTPAQERGDDLRGDEQPPDGSELTYHQWRLVVHNLRLVVWIAGRYRGIGLDLADLVQEGTLGLMKAARRFDTTRGYRFTRSPVHLHSSAKSGAYSGICRTARIPVSRRLVQAVPSVSLRLVISPYALGCGTAGKQAFGTTQLHRFAAIPFRAFLRQSSHQS